MGAALIDDGPGESVHRTADFNQVKNNWEII
jgi:hypothetical protein